MGREGAQKARLDGAVGVDDDDRVGRRAGGGEPLDRPGERAALAAGVGRVALEDPRPGGRRLGRGVVGAVVGDHDHVEALGRPVEGAHGGDRRADACALVVGGDQDGDARRARRVAWPVIRR